MNEVEITKSEARIVRKVSKSIPTMEGAGVRLRRAFGFNSEGIYDPFLLLDHFQSSDPEDYIQGFPWHPHRGIETITYMLRGELEHQDSMGNKGMIVPGSVQWMTAGSGIIHQEMPVDQGEDELLGFQLWANLPAKHKMMTPRYRDIKPNEIPLVERKDGSKIKIICGNIEGVEGPAKDIITKPTYLDITIPPRTEFTLETPDNHTAFAYVIDGEAYFDPRKDTYAHDMSPDGYLHFERDPIIRPRSLVRYKSGKRILVSTKDLSVRFLFASGIPLKEPIAWYGPIVMNTRKQLKQAFDDYRNGNFIKDRVKGVERSKR